MTEIISLITVIIALITAVLSAFGRVPWWAFLVPAGVFILGTAPKWVKWCYTAPRRWRRRRREQKLINEYWEELRRLMLEFRERTDSGRESTATLVSAITVNANLGQSERDYYNSDELRGLINGALPELVALLDLQTKRKGNLLSLAYLLGTFVERWHYFILRRVRRLRQDLERTNYSLNQSQKDDYVTHRKWHTDFIDDFARFAKRVNEDFGEKPGVIDRFEPLPDL